MSKIETFLNVGFFSDRFLPLLPNNEFDIFACINHNQNVKGESEDTPPPIKTVPVIVTSHNSVKTDPVS